MSVAGLTAGLQSAKSKINNYRASQTSRASVMDLGDYQPDMPHIKEGWMAKKGGVGGQKMWKKRWFVLTTEYLIYCAKQAAPVGPNVKGQVKLSDAYLVETSATKRELCFQLCTPDRTYYFEPLSTTDRADWIRKLKACLDKRLDTASVLRSGFLLKLGGKVGPLMNSKMIPSALKSPSKVASLPEEKSKALQRDAQKTKWQKRFFVLRMGELAYYAQQRDIFPPEKRKGTIYLRNSYIVAETNIDPAHPNAFELVSGDRSYTLDIGEEQGRNMFSNNGDERCATKGEWISSLLLANPTAVFGVPLKVACERSNNNNPKALVPAPLVLATQWLNKHALREEGLYRIPGSKAEVEKFIKKYDAGEPVIVPENYFGGNLASLVVQFIRRCPENLFTEQYAPVFEKIVDDYHSGVDTAKQLHMLKKLIAMLPPVNLATIRCLLDHLLQVAALSEENHMTVDKLSMCVYAKMAPTLGICLQKYDQLFGDLGSNAGTETTDDVARLLQETEEKEKRERMARQEREEREEMARLKKSAISTGLTSNDDDSDEDEKARVTVSRADDKIRCACGEMLEENAVFCGDCGQPVEKKTAKVESKTPEPKKVATNTRRGLEFGELKCPSCGAVAEPGIAACDQCGGKIPGVDATSNSPKQTTLQKREDSPAPRKVSTLTPPSSPPLAGTSPSSSPAAALKKSGSNVNLGNKYPLSPFQPERDRVATLETINLPVQPPPETTPMLDALKVALPNKADKWADWVAKLKASGISNVGDLKAMDADKLNAIDCPALLRSVLNRIRSGDPMPSTRASDAAPLRCVCGETNVPGAAFCDKCGTKIQSIATGPRFSFSVPSPQPAPSPVRGAVGIGGAKPRSAPAPPPFSGTSPTVPNTPSSGGDGQTCPSCNATCNSTTSFCDQCGTRLTGSRPSISINKFAQSTTTATTTNAPALSVRGRVTTTFPPGAPATTTTAPTTTTPTTTPSPTVAPNIVNRPSPSRTIGGTPAGSISVSSTTTTVGATTFTNRPTISRAGFAGPGTSASTTVTSVATTTVTTTITPSSGGIAQRMAALSVSSGGLKCVCGEPHAAGAGFCDQCGAKLGGAPGATSAAPVASRWGGGANARAGPTLSVSTATSGLNPPKSPIGGATTTAFNSPPKSPMGGAVASSSFNKPANSTPPATTSANSTNTAATTKSPITINAPSTTTPFQKTPAPAPSPASTGPKPISPNPVSTSPFGPKLTTTTPTATSSTPTTVSANKSPSSAPVAARAASSPAPAPAFKTPSPLSAPRPSVSGAKCSCGHSSPPGNLFCDQCGAKLAGGGSSPTVAPLVRAPSVARRVQSPFLS